MATRNPWHRTIFRLSPILALLSLFLALACIAFTGVVVYRANRVSVGSNGTDSTHAWLSTTVTASNLLTRFSFGQALPLYWWRAAMAGSSIGRLHRQWEVGRGFLNAIKTPRGFGLVFVTTMLTTFLAADQPLMQRALSQQQYDYPLGDYFDIWIPSRLPEGFSGPYDFNAGIDYPSKELSQAYNDSLLQLPLVVSTHGCDPGCIATLSVPSVLPISCSDSLVSVSVHDFDAWPHYSSHGPLLFEIRANYSVIPAAPWLGPPGTAPDTVAPQPNDRESVGIFTARADNVNGIGQLHFQQCWLVSATLGYQVYILQNGSLEILDPSPAFSSATMARNTRYLAEAFRSSAGAINTTLVTMFARATPSYRSFLYLESDYQTVNSGSQSAFGQTMILNETYENFRAKDPMPAVIDRVNNILFYAGIIYGTDHNGTSAPAHVRGRLFNPTYYYIADWRFFGAAAGLEVLVMLAVLCLLRDYRRLGRRVSLSPIEIAMAFDAPLFQSVNTNSDVKDIVNQIGDTRVRYGVLKEGLIGGDRKDEPRSDGEEGQADRLVFAES